MLPDSRKRPLGIELGSGLEERGIIFLTLELWKKECEMNHFSEQEKFECFIHGTIVELSYGLGLLAIRCRLIH